MAAGPKVEVVGARQLAATLRICAQQLRRMNGPGTEAARLVAQQVGAAAPRRTGRLANSVRVLASRNGEATAGSSLVYAPVINGGWPAHNIRANPFAERGLARAEPRVIEIYRRGVDTALGHVKGA